jgi:hypothetical protein
MEQVGAHPRAVNVKVNVNVKEFNPADSAYETLYSGVEHSAWSKPSPAQRKRLKQTQKTASLDARVDAKLSQVCAVRDAQRPA